MVDGDNYRQLHNVRFVIPSDTIDNWINNNPVILPGELITAVDVRNIKIGVGKRYTDTLWLYIGSEPWDLKALNSQATLSGYDSVTPKANTIRHEDYLKVDNFVLFPITLARSVKRPDGTSLERWMDNIDQGKLPNKILTLGQGHDAAILQNSGSMRQKLLILDNTTDDSVYLFQLSTDSGSTWKNLMTINKLGEVTATRFVGVADQAKALQSSRAIALSGVVSGTIPFNGSANVTIPTTFTSTALADLGAAPKNLIVKNISVPISSWNATTKQFEYANSAILNTMSPSVRFAKASIDIASKANIICWTDPGKLVLEAKTIPTANMTIEVVIFTPC